MLNRTALCHFASGIFWKASVIEVARPGRSAHPAELAGREIRRRVQAVFIGSGAFPDQCAIDDLALRRGRSFPSSLSSRTSGEAADDHAHRFFVPGLCFHMLLGRVLPDDVPPIWGSDAGEVPIMVHSTRQDGVHQDVFGAFDRQSKERLRKLKRLVV